MFHHISWTAHVRAADEDQAKRRLESICEHLQAPLELDLLMPLPDGGFRLQFNSPLFFEERWQAIHEAFLTATRICPAWDIQGPHEGEDGRLRYQGAAVAEELALPDVRHLHFEAVDIDLELPEDRLGPPATLELGESSTARLADARGRALRLLLRIESEVDELREDGLDPLEDDPPILDHLMTGYDFVRQSGGCHAAMRLVALERLLHAACNNDEETAQVAIWVLRRATALSRFLWKDDVKVLCALATSAIQTYSESAPQLPVVHAALQAALPAAEEQVRTRATDAGSVHAVLALVDEIERRPELYQRHAALMRQLRTSLRHSAKAPSIGKSPFAATDPWGRAMREVDLGSALPLIQFLAGGRPGRARDTKWRRRCHQHLADTDCASHVLQVMVNTVVLLAAEHPDQDPILLRSGEHSIDGENLVLLIHTAWALAQLDAPWIPNALADLALSMERRCQALSMAALRTLGERSDPDREELLTRVRSEATGTHLRMAAERQLQAGARRDDVDVDVDEVDKVDKVDDEVRDDEVDDDEVA